MVVYIQRKLEKMKDKNGFTLPEVLTVITILAVIMILAISSAVRMLDQTKRKISEYDKQILLDAAKSYGEDLDKNNKSYYPTKDIVLSSKTIYKDSEVKGYEFMQWNVLLQDTILRKKERRKATERTRVSV